MVLMSVAILGLGKGAKAVFQSLILPNNVPYEKLASANGLLMVINGILSLIVGPLIGTNTISLYLTTLNIKFNFSNIIGVIHDLGESYLYSLHSTSILSMLCIVLWTVDYLLRSRNIEKCNNNNTIDPS